MLRTFTCTYRQNELYRNYSDPKKSNTIVISCLSNKYIFCIIFYFCITIFNNYTFNGNSFLLSIILVIKLSTILHSFYKSHKFSNLILKELFIKRMNQHFYIKKPLCLILNLNEGKRALDRATRNKNGIFSS